MTSAQTVPVTPGRDQPPAPADSTAAPDSVPAPALRSLAQWKTACLRLPSNRALRGNPVPRELLPLPRFGELDELLSKFFEQCKSGSLGQTNLWLGGQPGGGGFYNTETAYFLAPNAPSSALVRSFISDTKIPRGAPNLAFQPFALKLQVPEGAEIFLHADLHGDIRSLLADLSWLNEQGYLRDFTVARPGFHMIFLGDYADRGRYGVEVLYTLLRLKLANPDNVFLARGNHEEVSLAARYGFLSEGRLKYGAGFDAAKVLRAYDFLPVVIYAGTRGNYIQCNHGGMEPGFDPRQLLDVPGTRAYQLVGTLKQRQFLDSHPGWFARNDLSSRGLSAQVFRDFRPGDPFSPSVVGFMWNDFSVFADEPGFAIDPGRAFIYGQRATQYLLAQTRTASNAIQAVFRGHQQSPAPNPMMRRLLASRGVFRHWQPLDSPGKSSATVRELEEIVERGAERPVPPGSVWTLNVAPDSVYGEACGYGFDTFGILKMSGTLADWRLKVINVE